jgi:hypothetical protein
VPLLDSDILYISHSPMLQIMKSLIAQLLSRTAKGGALSILSAFVPRVDGDGDHAAPTGSSDASGILGIISRWFDTTIHAKRSASAEVRTCVCACLFVCVLNICVSSLCLIFSV